MRRLPAILIALVAAALFLVPGLATAGKGGGTQDPPPDNPPCDADHGHPAENLLRQGKECPPANTGNQTGQQTGNQTGNQTTGNGTTTGTTTNGTTTNGTTTTTTTTTGENLCTAGSDDPGIVTPDTLGQTLWDSGVQVPPLTEDPEANGPLSGEIYAGGNDTPVEPLTDELACLIDFLIDEESGVDI